ncbi:MAG: class I SAM-dependent methyltransferase [Candidatus Thiodiazotropha sp. (ex Monitilora ramsayi)]|nr:class I SAM-dependent methyltransferase [Candidatus Thiodiazotropha sp. (ex Monitilora ramsayi)]
MTGYDNFYTGSEYADKNPTWDIEDTQWKANKITEILNSNNLKIDSICEIGCGSGGILAGLRSPFPDSRLTGYDIAPSAAQFWPQWDQLDIHFTTGDFLTEDDNFYDLLLLIDVLEHLADPHDFLRQCQGKSRYLLIHFPLDLSALSVVRETPLLHVRRKVGHIHYFTKNLALELLHETGFHCLDIRYTGAYRSAPQRSIGSRLFGLARWFVHTVSKDLGVRLLGGETLMVLVENPSHTDTAE